MHADTRRHAATSDGSDATLQRVAYSRCKPWPVCALSVSGASRAPSRRIACRRSRTASTPPTPSRTPPHVHLACALLGLMGRVCVWSSHGTLEFLKAAHGDELPYLFNTSLSIGEAMHIRSRAPLTAYARRPAGARSPDRCTEPPIPLTQSARRRAHGHPRKRTALQARPCSSRRRSVRSRERCGSTGAASSGRARRRPATAAAPRGRRCRRGMMGL